MFSKSSDGCLPEITLYFKNNEDKQNTIRFLIDQAQVDQNIVLWSNKFQKDIRPAKMSKGELAENLESDQHIQLTDLFKMPEIGLGIFDCLITLDFRTGDVWDRDSIDGLIKLLLTLKKTFKVNSITLDEDKIFFSDEEIEFFRVSFI